jgi:ABC-type ATPase involved in cell division
MTLLKKINDNGRTVIVATHDKSFVSQMAKKVLELDKGSLVSSKPKNKPANKT